MLTYTHIILIINITVDNFLNHHLGYELLFYSCSHNLVLNFKFKLHQFSYTFLVQHFVKQLVTINYSLTVKL